MFLGTQYSLRNRQRITQEASGTSTVTSVPASVGGVNYRVPLDVMPPTDAYELLNWYPDYDALVSRPGLTEHVFTGEGVEATTLLEYKSGATSKLLAATSGKLWDVSTTNNSQVGGSYSNDFWQGQNFGGFLVLTNGEDVPLYYNGATAAVTNFTASADTASTFVDVHSYASRLFFVQKDTANYFFGPVGAVTGGAVSKVDLSQVAFNGGNLLTIKSLSFDGGDDLRDYVAFIFDNGEVLVYAGTDPSDANAWSLYGRYNVSPPIGQRCAVQHMGDVIILTKTGPVPLSLVMKSGSEDVANNDKVWGKIRPRIRDLFALYGDNARWQLFRSANGEMIIINVQRDDGTYQQVVLNTLVGAWTEYDVDASVWGNFQGDIYVGGRDNVGAVWDEATWDVDPWNEGGKVYTHSGTTDNGSKITLRAREAFTYLGSRGFRKQVTQIRPIIQGDGNLTAQIGVDIDFSRLTFEGQTRTLINSAGAADWDTATWDAASWSAQQQPYAQWLTTGGTGRAFSVFFQADVDTQVKWYSTDYLHINGGTL